MAIILQKSNSLDRPDFPTRGLIHSALLFAVATLIYTLNSNAITYADLKPDEYNKKYEFTKKVKSPSYRLL